MGVGGLPARLHGLRFRVLVDDYEGHPPVPPGTVVNAIGNPSYPEFLVLELDAPIDVERPSGPGSVAIRHLAVSPIGWDWGVLVRPPARFTPLIVQVWHVFDPRLATSKDWTPDAMAFVARGSLTRIR